MAALIACSLGLSALAVATTANAAPWFSDGQIVALAMPGSLFGALLALVLPRAGLLIGLRTAALIAGVLTVGATALFVVAESYYRPGGDVRLDLVIIPPLLLAAWIVFLYRIVAALEGPAASSIAKGLRILLRGAAFILAALLLLVVIVISVR